MASSSSSPFKESLLEGKVALITGGATGIGFEMATQFCKHGASVALMGRRQHVLHEAVASLRDSGFKVLPLISNALFFCFSSLFLLYIYLSHGFLLSISEMVEKIFAFRMGMYICAYICLYVCLHV